MTDKTKSDFFDAGQAFIDAHHGCPDGPEHLRWFVWLPRNREECSLTVKCICGARVVLPASRLEGHAFVAACRMNGVAVTEIDQADGVH